MSQQLSYDSLTTMVRVSIYFSPLPSSFLLFFFFNDPATPEFYPLPLPAPLPIFPRRRLARRSAHRARHHAAPLSRCRRVIARQRHRRGRSGGVRPAAQGGRLHRRATVPEDRKSTRLNSSHSQISYAGLCLKTKKK